MERNRDRDDKEQQPNRGEPREDFDKGQNPGRSGGQGQVPDEGHRDQGQGQGQGSKGSSGNPQKKK